MTLPVTRFSTLMEKLLAFYTPPRSLQRCDQSIKDTLKEAHTIIMEETTSGDEDIVYMIAGRMLELWEQKHPGTYPDQVIEPIKDYAESYVTTIFRDMAHGDRATLQHQFEGMAGSCVAVYLLEMLTQRGEGE